MQATSAPDIKAWSYNTEKSLILGSSFWTIQNDVGCGTGEMTTYLKITSCKEGEFTCGNGLCVDLDKRCDGVEQCDDGTDEDKCKFIKLSESYKKQIAPITVIDSVLVPALVNISVELQK